MDGQLSFADEALLDFVNGKGITSDQFLAIVYAGYVQLTQKALGVLQELKGAVHDWNKEGQNGVINNNT